MRAGRCGGRRPTRDLAGARATRGVGSLSNVHDLADRWNALLETRLDAERHRRQGGRTRAAGALQVHLHAARALVGGHEGDVPAIHAQHGTQLLEHGPDLLLEAHAAAARMAAGWRGEGVLEGVGSTRIMRPHLTPRAVPCQPVPNSSRPAAWARPTAGPRAPPRWPPPTSASRPVR